MTHYSFMDDYSEGCHPAILSALADTNLIQQAAYGQDVYSIAAKTLIHKQLDNDAASIFFVGGGTQANLILIASLLRPYEAVIAAHSGHIALHETGAIEAVGHKIISMPSKDGKLRPEDIELALSENNEPPHMAKPRLVYISNATETGLFYTRPEIEALSKLCRKKSLYLMVDGARLGAALTATSNDLTLKDLSRLTDVFWIGGTKAGALLGEAIIINHPELAEDFAFHIKQRGALLAKGRVLGVQFETLFKDDLFFKGCEFANHQAAILSRALTDLGYELANETQTNQVFPILPNSVIARLQNAFKFHIWEEVEAEQSIVRLVTSWATDPKQVDAFIKALS